MAIRFGVFFSIFILFTVIVNGDNVKTTNKLEEEVLVLLTKWREGAVQTNLFKLPSIKAIQIDGVDSFYNGNGIKMKFTIGKMQLTGLDTFSLEKLSVTQTNDSIVLMGQIKVNTLTLHSDSYSLKGSAYYFYPIKGSGEMTIQCKHVDVLVTIRFVNNGDFSSKIDKFTLDYNINRVKANLEESSFLINQVLNAEGAAILKSYHNDIVNGTWNYAVPYANDYLSTVSLSDFVKTILNVSDSAYIIKDKK